MRRPAVGRGTFVVACLVTVLAGCAGDAVGPGARPAPPGPAEIGTEADCLADDVLAELGLGDAWEGRPAPAAGTIPADFEPVGVVECRIGVLLDEVVAVPPELVPDLSDLLDDEGHVDLDEVADEPAEPRPVPEPRRVSLQQVERAGDLTPLLEVLAQRSDPPREGEICMLMAELKPALYLLDADGRVVRTTWPTTSCGFLRPGALEALTSVPEVRVTTVERLTAA